MLNLLRASMQLFTFQIIFAGVLFPAFATSKILSRETLFKISELGLQSAYCDNSGEGFKCIQNTDRATCLKYLASSEKQCESTLKPSFPESFGTRIDAKKAGQEIVECVQSQMRAPLQINHAIAPAPECMTRFYSRPGECYCKLNEYEYINKPSLTLQDCQAQVKSLSSVSHERIDCFFNGMSVASSFSVAHIRKSHSIAGNSIHDASTSVSASVSVGSSPADTSLKPFIVPFLAGPTGVFPNLGKLTEQKCYESHDIGLMVIDKAANTIMIVATGSGAEVNVKLPSFKKPVNLLLLGADSWKIENPKKTKVDKIWKRGEHGEVHITGEMVGAQQEQLPGSSGSVWSCLKGRESSTFTLEAARRYAPILLYVGSEKNRKIRFPPLD